MMNSINVNCLLTVFLFVLFSCGQTAERPTRHLTSDNATPDAMPKDSADAELLSLVRDINARCPCRTAYDISIDSAKILSGTTLQMYYTDFRKGKGLNNEESLKAMKKADVESLKTSERAEMYRRKTITLQYIYYDSAGHILYQFSILPSEYTR